MTDREIVKQDIQELYLGNLGTVEFDLNLPAYGKNGSRITWHSDNLHFMDHTGKVHRPAYGRGNREVTLRARFSCGTYEEARSYVVTILEEGNQIEVESVYPVKMRAVTGERMYLPYAVAVRTRDGRVLSHFVEWEGGLERRWEDAGSFTVAGKLKDTAVEVKADVEVVKADAEAVKADAAMEEAVEDVGTGEPKHAVCGKQAKAEEEIGDCAAYVRLLEGSDFYAAQERMRQFLLQTNADQWLYNFRRAAGLPVGDTPCMTGWDAPDGLLRGHSTGHYLSALAACYLATKDTQILQKAVYMVDVLAACQEAFSHQDGYAKGYLGAYSEEQFCLLEKYTPYPKIWAPYYTLHKILAGLIDLYQLAGIQKARTIAEGIGDWIYNRLSVLPHEQRMKMWSIYIAGEYGGMNESLAKLGGITGEERYLQAARFFDNDRLFYPLEQGVDALDGMHANQHIPQIIGALELYGQTGLPEYYRIAERFWKIVTESHIYCMGGTGESEMFHEPGNIAGLLTKSTAESCATYNMLKLTNRLYAYRQDAAYMDYYERAVYNHTLSACDHSPTGGTTYFLSMRPRATKDFDLEENSCCHGTGMESAFKYGEGIFYANTDEIYVNLFIPSTMELPDETRLTICVREEEPGELTLLADMKGMRVLKIRKPAWAEGEAVVRVDGKACPVVERDGYLVLERAWDGAASIRVSFPCGLKYETAPDKEECLSLRFGPYVLAALTDQEERLFVRGINAEDEFERAVDGSLMFRNKESGIRFIPFAKVWKEEYQIYLKKK